MNAKEEAQKLADWMEQYNANAGSRGYVVGLSGGIDSAVTACLAVEAVGKENVIGVLMPCHSTDDCAIDAKVLAENLGIRYDTVDFEEVLMEFKIAMPMSINTMTQANTKARLRMTILYAIASEFGYLVAGTGNRSELEIGYATKFGDGGVDLEPLGNYFKREVYEIADTFVAIPESTKTKSPSAGLWDGQTDEDELGFTYDQLEDAIRFIYGYPRNAVDDDIIQKVAKMMKSNAHKNEAAPRMERS